MESQQNLSLMVTHSEIHNPLEETSHRISKLDRVQIRIQNLGAKVEPLDQRWTSL